MPVLAKFCGIIIRMLAIRLYPAHFHAFYEGGELVVGIAPLRIIQGEAPERVKALVLEWARQHPRELAQTWQRLSGRRASRTLTPMV